MTGGSIYDKRLADYLVERGTRVEIASVPDLPYFLSVIASLPVALWLAPRLLARRYDLVIEDGWAHPALAVLNLICLIFRRNIFRRARVVVIVHQLRWLEKKSPLAAAMVAAIERASLESSHLIVTVSRFMSREIERLIKDGVDVMIAPPGCDNTNAEPSSSRKQPRRPESTQIRLLFVGNCLRRNGVDHLIRAMAMLEGSRSRLDVVGDCDFEPGYYEELRREVHRLKLDDAVTFHGRVTNESLKEFYEQADIFAMPSLYEGFGIVYAEAMRAGLPIIASDVGPVREIVRDGENALLVPPGNPQALAEAISLLQNNPDLRDRFSRRSLELAVHLPTWQSTCETLYERLCSVIRHT